MPPHHHANDIDRCTRCMQHRSGACMYAHCTAFRRQCKFATGPWCRVARSRSRAHASSCGGSGSTGVAWVGAGTVHDRGHAPHSTDTAFILASPSPGVALAFVLVVPLYSRGVRSLVPRVAAGAPVISRVVWSASASGAGCSVCSGRGITVTSLRSMPCSIFVYASAQNTYTIAYG